MAVTAVLLAVFWYLVQKTPLGRAQRACEQDRKMAALLGVDVDRTISLTFVIGAALAAVAGTMYLLYYGVVNFADGFVPGVKAFTAAVLGGIGSLPGAVLGGLIIGLDRDAVVGLFLDRLQGRRRLLDPRHRADLHAVGHPRPARSREGLSGTAMDAPRTIDARRDSGGGSNSRPRYRGGAQGRRPRRARHVRRCSIPIIAYKTDQGPSNELILTPRWRLWC